MLKFIARNRRTGEETDARAETVEAAALIVIRRQRGCRKAVAYRESGDSGKSGVFVGYVHVDALDASKRAGDEWHVAVAHSSRTASADQRRATGQRQVLVRYSDGDEFSLALERHRAGTETAPATIKRVVLCAHSAQSRPGELSTGNRR